MKEEKKVPMTNKGMKKEKRISEVPADNEFEWDEETQENEDEQENYDFSSLKKRLEKNMNQQKVKSWDSKVFHH